MTTYTLKQLWEKACEHDGIPVDSKFVVFSTDNPWLKKYNTLSRLMLQQSMQQSRKAESA